MLKTLKAVADLNPITRRVANRVRSVVRPTREDQLRRMVRKAAAAVERPVFVKVGANDGIAGDPFGDSLLRSRAWKGLLVEPVPYCTERLRSIYCDESRFTVDPCAVGCEKGTATFYYVSESAKEAMPDLPVWYDQLGSFDRQHIVKHLGGRLEPYIVAIEVNVEPLHDILLRHRINEVALLHIDTEGHDLEVLKTLGLPSALPAWIMVEHKHLSDDDRQEMFSLLDSSGYDICDTGRDFFAMSRQADHGLQRRGQVGRLFDFEFNVGIR